MKCLVTGGAGFIGSFLCESLIDDGLKVLCIDNLTTGTKDNLKDFSKNPNFEFIQGDITKKQYFKDLKPDYIFHLASCASPNKNNPKSYINHPVETLLVNSLGTHNLLEVALKIGAKFLFASSSEVYGDPQVSPQKEDYFGNVNPLGPRSSYDEGKRFGEAITMAYFRKYGVDTRIVRIFNTYGPKMPDDGRVIFQFINQAIKGKPITVYGDGKQTRSFCFIEDMVGGIKKAMFSKSIEGKTINLGNPQELTILEIASLIKRILKSNSSFVFDESPEDDPKRRSPDITLAKKLLGWEPKVPLSEGLEKTIEYFKNQ